MQAFVRLPTEFGNFLLNAAGYFDVSPKARNEGQSDYTLLVSQNKYCFILSENKGMTVTTTKEAVCTFIEVQNMPPMITCDISAGRKDYSQSL